MYASSIRGYDRRFIIQICDPGESILHGYLDDLWQLLPSGSLADESDSSTVDSTDESVEEIVVIGTRKTNQSTVDLSVPVDVLTTDDLGARSWR